MDENKHVSIGKSSGNRQLFTLKNPVSPPNFGQSPWDNDLLKQQMWVDYLLGVSGSKAWFVATARASRSWEDSAADPATHLGLDFLAEQREFDRMTRSEWLGLND